MQVKHERLRVHTREFGRFLSIARGSLCEPMTLVDLSHRLGCVSLPQYTPLRRSCENLLTPLSGLIPSLQRMRRHAVVSSGPTIQRSNVTR